MLLYIISEAASVLVSMDTTKYLLLVIRKNVNVACRCFVRSTKNYAFCFHRTVIATESSDVPTIKVISETY